MQRHRGPAPARAAGSPDRVGAEPLQRDRASESLVDLCEEEQLAFLPWAPILDLDGAQVVREIADRRGATPRQVVLAWLLARSQAMLPIPGTSSVAHLESNVVAASVHLAPEEVAAITERQVVT